VSHSDLRVSILLGALSVIPGCRYDVQLQPGTDAAVDAFRSPDAGSDGAADDTPEDAPDAPPQTCAAGVALMSTRPTGADRGATIARSASPEGQRYGILVSPAVRDDSASTTRLLVIDGTGAILSIRELALLDGAGDPSETATLHSLPSGVGFLVLGERAIVLLDLEGATSSEVPLTVAPLASAQRRAGFVDDDRFVFVSSEVGGPLVVFDRTTGELTTTAIDTEGTAVVLVHRGGVTIGTDAPTETVEYAPSLNGDVTYRSDWPPAPLSRRLLGAYTAGGRRLWATADGEEFRNTVSLYEMPESAAPVSLMSATLVAPLEVTQEDELLTVAESTGDLAVVDYAGVAIERLGPFTAGSIERGETGYVVLTVESGALTFRCVP
jgi:hypothetical protein